MENGPFIDGLPIKNGDFPWDISSCMVSTWQFFVDASPFIIGPASTHVCAQKKGPKCGLGATCLMEDLPGDFFTLVEPQKAHYILGICTDMCICIYN